MAQRTETTVAVLLPAVLLSLAGSAAALHARACAELDLERRGEEGASGERGRGRSSKRQRKAGGTDTGVATVAILPLGTTKCYEVTSKARGEGAAKSEDGEGCESGRGEGLKSEGEV